jgi:hypothetical protein
VASRESLCLSPLPPGHYFRSPTAAKQVDSRPGARTFACPASGARERQALSRLQSAQSSCRSSTVESSLGSIMVDMLAANGGQATAFIILGSIVVPLVLLAVVCWFFWIHRHDD